MAITKINTPELFDLGSTNTSVQLPSGNTASRPSSPSTGEWRFNTDDNKVEYWDGSAWTTIEDEAMPVTSSENFNVNTYVGSGATQTIDAQFNEAAVFNGVNPNGSVIDLAGLKSFFTQKQTVSLSMWFNTEGVSTDNSYLFSDYNSSSYNIFAYITTTGLLKVSNRMNGTTNTFTSSSAYDDSQWYHLVITNDATSRVVTVYINGSSIGTTNISANSWNTGSLGKLGIGAFYSTTNSRWQQSLKGFIDQVRIFNTALTQQQVTDLYNDETIETAGTLNFPTGAGCIAAYQLDGDASDVGGTYGGVPTDLGFVGLKFEPGLVWVKNRTGTAYDHKWADSVRGATKIIESSTTDAEITATGSINAFNTNGFTIGSDSSVNGNGNDFVAWCWKAASSNSTNNEGSIPSTVRANQEAGFSIVKWTGTSASNPTVGHGLSQVDLYIVKELDNGTASWLVGGNSTLFPETGTTASFLRLNTTDDIDQTGIDTFGVSGNTIKVGARTNNQEDSIAYCFHSVDGYQKIDSYQGTGATGNYVETGFEPAWLMIKETSSTGNWRIVDNKRDTTNPRVLGLWANLNNIENTSTTNVINFYSNGFSLEGSGGDTNTNGQTYMYLAIAADAEPTPVLADSFDVVTYTGNGSTQSILTDLKPDFVWVKNESAQSNYLFDTVRGDNAGLFSDLTDAEVTSANYVSFDSNGFTTGSTNNINNNVYVAWCWKAAGIGAINTEGSIKSIANANQAAGFSIVKYKANGSVGATFGHGLSSAPELVIWKEIDNPDDWMTIADINGTYQRAKLNTADIFSTSMSGATNNVDPNDTVITLGNSGSTNSNGLDYIVYCFHSVPGYSQVGTYNLGTSGTVKTVVTGFQPRFVMFKSVDYSSGWFIFDSLRGDGRLFANSSQAESTSTAGYNITLNPDGFTMSGTGVLSSGNSFPNDDVLYLAIA